MVGNLIFYGNHAAVNVFQLHAGGVRVERTGNHRVHGFYPFGYTRYGTGVSSLCTTTTLCVWLNPTYQNRIFPTVPMSSVTGRPRGCAGCGGSPWGSQRARGRQCAEQYRLLSYLYFLPNLLKDHTAIVCKLWGFMRILLEEEICRETASSKTPTDVFAPKSTGDAQNFACFVKERSTQ